MANGQSVPPPSRTLSLSLSAMYIMFVPCLFGWVAAAPKLKMHASSDPCVDYVGQNPSDLSLRGSHWLERSQAWVSGVSSMTKRVDDGSQGHGAGQVC